MTGIPNSYGKRGPSLQSIGVTNVKEVMTSTLTPQGKGITQRRNRLSHQNSKKPTMGSLKLTQRDETLLENEDDEETKKTKEIMKGVMDDMFGVTEEIPENTYMNIVNKMKEIYDRL